MKTTNSFLLLIGSLLISLSIFAGGGSGGVVPPPPGMPPCAVNPAPGNTACVATPICNVHGFCGTTSASYSADYWSQLNSAFCGSIENNSFLTFTAESSSITFDAYVYNCIAGEEGIQVMILDAANCNSGAITNFVCVSPMYAQNAPYSITANGLIPGNQYYIMIDGWAGDVCDYTFVAVDGVALPLGLDIGNNVTICQGETVTPTAFGGDGTYTWDPSPDLNATSGATVTITPPNAVGSYQYVVHSQGGVPNCPTANSDTLTVNVIQCCSIVSNDVSLLSCDATNGVYSVTGEITITGPQTVGSLVINDCNGNVQTLPLGSTPYTYTITGLDLDVPNCAIETYFSNDSECSHVLSHVLNYTAPVTTTPTFNSITHCEGDVASILPSASLEGITGTWSPAIINTSLTGVTNYTFTPDPGFCSPSVLLGVTINPKPIINVTDPVVFDCTSGDVVLQGSSPTSGTTILWTDIYGGDVGIVSGETTENPTVSSSGGYIITATSLEGCVQADTVNVIGNGNEPQISIDDPIDLNCANTTTTLLGTVSSSAGDPTDLIHNWSTPDGSITSGTNGTTADIDGVGTYVYTVTDQSNGCVTSVLVLVEGDLDAPVIILNTPLLEINCLYPQLPLGGTSDIGSIGVWTTSTGGMIGNLDTLGMNYTAVNTPGTYTYTVVNPSSLCSESVDVVITENTALPTVSAGPDLAICDSATTVLQGTASSNSGGALTYSWSATDGNVWLYDFSDILNPEVPADVTYILTVTDVSNGCVNSDTVQLFHYQQSTIFTDTTVCGTNFQVPQGSVSVIGQFTWSELNNGGTFNDSSIVNPIFTPSNPNEVSYTLVITDACSSINANVTIVPPPSVSSPSDVCEDPKELITTSYGAGTWTGTGVTFNVANTITNNDITTVTTNATASPGTYTVTFSSNDACNYTETLTLVFPQPVAIFADTVVCATSFQVPVGSVVSSGAGQWSVSPAGSGVFTPSNTTMHPIFTPNTGVVSVTLTFEDPCSSDNAVVVFPPRPVVQTPPAYSCGDMQEFLYVTTYSGGQWSVNDNPATTWHEDTALVFLTNPVIAPGGNQASTWIETLPTAGVYTLTFTENGCGYSETITVNMLPYPWTYISDTTVCAGVEYQLTAWQSPYELSYQWNTGANGISTIVTSPGMYTVEASNACYSYSDSALISFVACDITAPNVISLSSQSGNNTWFVDSYGVAEFNCIIVNRWGNLIYEYNDPNGGWDGRDKAGNVVSEGVYFYKIKAKYDSGEEVDKQGFVHVVH